MPRTTTVHLLTGDYPDRLSQLAEAAQGALNDEAPRTMLDEHPYEALSQQYAALKAEAIEAGTTVHLASLARPVWRKLKMEHPPRTEGDEDTVRGDKILGCNGDEVEDDLVYESVKAWQAETGESVDYGSSRSAFDEWAAKLSEGEWQVLVSRAWELTNGVRLDPKDLPPLPTMSEG